MKKVFEFQTNGGTIVMFIANKKEKTWTIGKMIAFNNPLNARSCSKGEFKTDGFTVKWEENRNGLLINGKKLDVHMSLNKKQAVAMVQK